jgi:hypothetical protein
MLAGGFAAGQSGVVSQFRKPWLIGHIFPGKFHERGACEYGSGKPASTGQVDGVGGCG